MFSRTKIWKNKGLHHEQQEECCICLFLLCPMWFVVSAARRVAFNHPGVKNDAVGDAVFELRCRSIPRGTSFGTCSLEVCALIALRSCKFASRRSLCFDCFIAYPP